MVNLMGMLKNMIYPGARLHDGPPSRSKLVKVIERSYEEVARIQFRDFIALKPDER